MNPSSQFKMTVPTIRNSVRHSPIRRVSLLIPLVFVCFGLSPAVRAVSPAPDGGYPDFNTAEGDDALFSLTTGAGNAAIGAEALFSNTTGNFNTATGIGALLNNTTASNNTATGAGALFSNTTIGVNSGDDNTATGFVALFSNTTGDHNTASGSQALDRNTIGGQNTATGTFALSSNDSGDSNTAMGVRALISNTTGDSNTANGIDALFNNIDGGFNTAIGQSALANNTHGIGNTAVGAGVGLNVTTASNVICIGAAGQDVSNSCFIGNISGVNEGGTVAVVTINGNGQLGTQAPVVSSRRFKKDIKPMDQASEAILRLKPVTFDYKSDSTSTPQFGLIAEEVAEVNPDLIVRDDKGEIYTVRYEAVNAMLLNEFLKEHRRVTEQNRKIHEQESTITQLRKEMHTVVARLKEQDSKIQKVSDRLELNKPAPQTVLNNH